MRLHVKSRHATISLHLNLFPIEYQIVPLFSSWFSHISHVSLSPHQSSDKSTQPSSSIYKLSPIMRVFPIHTHTSSQYITDCQPSGTSQAFQRKIRFSTLYWSTLGGMLSIKTTFPLVGGTHSRKQFQISRKKSALRDATSRFKTGSAGKNFPEEWLRSPLWKLPSSLSFPFWEVEKRWRSSLHTPGRESQRVCVCFA